MQCVFVYFYWIVDLRYRLTNRAQLIRLLIY